MICQSYWPASSVFNGKQLRMTRTQYLLSRLKRGLDLSGHWSLFFPFVEGLNYLAKSFLLIANARTEQML